MVVALEHMFDHREEIGVAVPEPLRAADPLRRGDLDPTPPERPPVGAVGAGHQRRLPRRPSW